VRDIRREADALLFRLQNALDAAAEVPPGTLAALRALAESVEAGALPAPTDAGGFRLERGPGALLDGAEPDAPHRPKAHWTPADKALLWRFLEAGGADGCATRAEAARAFLADSWRKRHGPGGRYSARDLGLTALSESAAVSLFRACEWDAAREGVPMPWKGRRAQAPRKAAQAQAHRA